jgi:hypothetical protein
LCDICDQDTENNDTVKPLKITEDQLEDLGRIADMADNYHAAAGMQLPASMHIDCLRTGMTAISEQIKAIYVKTSGANPWQLDKINK